MTSSAIAARSLPEICGSAKGGPFIMTGDIERLILVQHQVIKLRRLAAQIPDREISLNLHSLADQIEHRSREADRRLCSPI
jgi:hypothetical protein